LRTGRVRRKQKAQVSPDPTVSEILDAIAERMGPLYPTPTRSDLPNEAARLFIDGCTRFLPEREGDAP
jgi:hypothetical protein